MLVKPFDYIVRCSQVSPKHFDQKLACDSRVEWRSIFESVFLSTKLDYEWYAMVALTVYQRSISIPVVGSYQNRGRVTLSCSFKSPPYLAESLIRKYHIIHIPRL